LGVYRYKGREQKRKTAGGSLKGEKRKKLHILKRFVPSMGPTEI